MKLVYHKKEVMKTWFEARKLDVVVVLALVV